jgi:heme-degrading monooxygenase HmoA
MADEPKSQAAISLFRFRMRDLAPARHDEYKATSERLRTVAAAMPGFVSFRSYTGDNGELLVTVEFASAEALAAWRDHPDHQRAQQRGREEFYAEYQVINCAVMYKHGYKHP